VATQPNRRLRTGGDRRRPPIGEFALHTISIPRSEMNVPIVQLRVHHTARRSRGSHPLRSGAVTNNFPSLRSLTRRSGQCSGVTGMAPLGMRSRERLVRAIAAMSATAERPFLTGACLLSLAAPPTGTPLRGRRAFGSSLEGIPQPSPRSSRHLHPLTREQSRSLKNKKGTSCPQKPSPRSNPAQGNTRAPANWLPPRSPPRQPPAHAPACRGKSSFPPPP